MVMFHEVEMMLEAPLETVAIRCCSAPFLQWLYETSLQPLAEAHPDKLPPPERKDVAARDKKPKKPYLATLLTAVLRDPKLGLGFYERLPSPTQKAIAALTWSKAINLAALEEAIGSPVAIENPGEQRIYEPYLLLPEHGFLMVHSGRSGQWRYYGSQSGPPKKKDLLASLPIEVRQCFRNFLPSPPDYELNPIADLPAKAGIRSAAGPYGIADLRLVLGFIEQGHLKRTKSDRVTLPSIHAVREMIQGPEFFPDADETDLAVLRSRLLTVGTSLLDPKERAEILANPDRPELLRTALGKMLVLPTFLHAELLGHLDSPRNRWLDYHPPSVKALPAFFAKFPPGQWVSWENIATYHLLREKSPSLFPPDATRFQANLRAEGNPWEKTFLVGGDEIFPLVAAPLLKGYAFLLAALGMAEIAYDPPRRVTRHLPGKHYLSPFDGLRYVRLTGWGEFVLGRRKSWEIDAGPAKTHRVILDETRLLATCLDADALTRLALERLLEPFAPGRYRLTAKSLLGGCATRADIEKRILLFRQVVSDRPPALWEDFFSRTLARVAPLIPEPEFVVLKLTDDEELRRHLTSDPILREIVLKVEGLRIAVRQGDLRKLTKRLEQFGYLSPVA